MVIRMNPAHDTKNPPGQARRLGDIIDRVWRSASEEPLVTKSTDVFGKTCYIDRRPSAPVSQEGPKTLVGDDEFKELRGRVLYIVRGCLRHDAHGDSYTEGWNDAVDIIEQNIKKFLTNWK